MVDPQSVDDAFAYPAQYEPVAVGEYSVFLDTNTHELVYVEKAAVLALLGRGAPERQPVVLALQERVEGVGAGADGFNLAVEGGGHLRVFGAQDGQAGAEDLLVPVALADAGPVRCPRRWEPAQRGADALDLGPDRRLGAARQVPGRSRDQLVQAPGGDGHLLVVVAQDEAAGRTLELEPPGLELPAVMVAQEGQEDDGVRPAVAPLWRSPVDVEVAGVDARGPVFEDVPPPTVVPRRHGHVVGHDVEYLAEPSLAQRLLQLGVTVLAAQFLVDCRRVDHVVAMGAPLRGLEHG